MRVFLTGGTGFIGNHLRAALHEAGHTVVALTRHAQPDDAGTTWVRGTLDDAAIMASGMAGCDAVVHLVGIIRETRDLTFAQAHVAGTAQVLAAMGKAGLRRLLHMSALGAGPDAETEYYHTKWEAEQLVRAVGVDATIFRPSLVFGPGAGFTQRIIDQITRLPVIPIIGSGEYTFMPISIHAVSAAFVQALALGGPTYGKTYELCGAEVLSYTSLIVALSNQLGIHKPVVHLPIGFMRLLTGVASALHLPFPITSDQLTMLLGGSRCARRETFPFDLPEITFKQGIAEYV
jgi:NADH dehydrogenase